jgi:hypothetical protein
MLIRYVVVLVSVVPIVSDSSLLDAIPMPELLTAETRTGMGMGIEIRSSAPHHSRWKRVFDALDFFFRASPSWHTFGEWVNVDICLPFYLGVLWHVSYILCCRIRCIPLHAYMLTL